METARPDRDSPLPPPGSAEGVILLHGLGRTGRSMRTIARHLERCGYATLSPTYSSLTRSLPDIVRQLDPSIRAFQAQFTRPVHFVTHSLGALVLRAWLTKALAQDTDGLRVGRTVMLGPPNQGSEWADLVIRMGLQRVFLGKVAGALRTRRTASDEALLAASSGETGVIAGDRSLDPIFPRMVLPAPHDGKVSLASTRLDGMQDHIVVPASHTLMIMRPFVVRQVEAFLRDGRFQRT